MDDGLKTSVELRAELKAARARLNTLSTRRVEINTELAAIGKEIAALSDGYYKMAKLVAVAEKREETESLPAVRVINSAWRESCDWRFAKKTPKCIYLRRMDTLAEEYFGLDGASEYRGRIHPDDLAAILDGSIVRQVKR